MTLPDTCEETVLHKVWWKILPFVFVLFMINMLDRVNIGYTALGMNADLGIDPSTFGLISGIFSSGISSLRSRATRSFPGSGPASGLPGSW
jgi:hypothetical protein